MTQIKRSAGQSATAAAAYRSGEKLYSDYYGIVSDYTRKSGVVCSEILLPSHAPPEYADRQTLWDAVENAERSEKAQLAYSFDIALQNEFSLEENIALARQFLLDEFVSRGMIVDFAVHQPEPMEGGIANPHFHVLCPIRPLKDNGELDAKQHREYLVDENGAPVLDDAGHKKFRAVPTNDWGSPETLEHWRAAWAERVNEKFAEKGLEERIDHRSYERQGVDQLPTIHEGPAVRQMEARGLETDRGNLNRWIQRTNLLLQQIRARIAKLTEWLQEIKAAMAEPPSPSLISLVTAYFDQRNAKAWSNKAKVANLQKLLDTSAFLKENNLHTLADLEDRLSQHNATLNALKAGMDIKKSRSKELQQRTQQAKTFVENKPIYDELNAIRWKGKREAYRQAHEGELRLFYMARRKLQPHFTEDNKLPLTAWRREQKQIDQDYAQDYAKYKAVREDLKKLSQIKICVDTTLRREQREQEWTR